MTASDVVVPPSLDGALDRTNTEPLYLQLANALERSVHSGELPAGARLENEVSLAQRLGLSRATMRRALQELVDKGLFVRRRGVGTVVMPGRITRTVALTSLFEDLERAGQRPTQRVLEHHRRPADPEVADRLDVALGADVLTLRRLRFADAAPIAILTNHLPDPGGDLTVERLGSHGLYQVLRSEGITVSVAKQWIGARTSTAEEAALLEIETGGALLTMERIAYDHAGRVVEAGSHVYRPDRYAYEATLVAK